MAAAAVGIAGIGEAVLRATILICPHLVTPFTLSLDAIKAYEYAAVGRPVITTPTSGFQA